MSEWAGRYRCGLTGWEGEAYARTETVEGQVEIGLVRLDNEGKPDERWFPSERLIRCEDAQPRMGF